MIDPRETWSRRKFVGRLALAGTAGFLGVPTHVVAEAPPGRRGLRSRGQAVRQAPQYAEELLRVEGFTDVQYVDLARPAAAGSPSGAGEADHAELHRAAATPTRRWR
jgi:NitT/TauT family transport system substrate-binding protein